MADIKIGVLIPTFNRLEFLRESLESVIQQSYQHLEILVVDNGSSDGTQEFMASVKDPRVRYVVNENNIGLAGSVNRGFALFSSDIQWSAILCDDDLMDPVCIEASIRTIERLSARSIVYGRINFVDCTGKPVRASRPHPQEETAFEYLRNRLRCQRETYLSGVFVNCRAAREMGGYPRFTTGLACDDAFIFALALQDRLCFASDAVVSARIHEGAESQETGRIADHLQAIDEFKDYVIAKAATVSLTDNEQHHFYKRLELYVQQLRGIMWLRGVHSCFGVRTGHNAANDLESLYDLVAGRIREFPQRVKFAVFMRKWLNIHIESIVLYRKLCIGIVRLLRRFVW
jgi:glycosyltransferase involved in cell wall biosynthesis